MFKDIEAVVFDIDGTLYPDWKLFFLMSGHFFRNIWLYYVYKHARDQLHRTAPLPDLYEYQARLMADGLRTDSATARQLTEKICYKDLEKYFKVIKPFPYAKECIENFKKAGLKIGILSDYPPEQKGDIWGIRDLCDVLVGSEECGALKPSIYPFGIVSQKLGIPPEKILYVGNSMKYDVMGAKKAGMKSAYILRGFKKLFGIKNPVADISFTNYRQLEKIVLE